MTMLETSDTVAAQHHHMLSERMDMARNLVRAETKMAELEIINAHLSNLQDKYHSELHEEQARLMALEEAVIGYLTTPTSEYRDALAALVGLPSTVVPTTPGSYKTARGCLQETVES